MVVLVPAFTVLTYTVSLASIQKSVMSRSGLVVQSYAVTATGVLDPGGSRMILSPFRKKRFPDRSIRILNPTDKPQTRGTFAPVITMVPLVAPGGHWVI